MFYSAEHWPVAVDLKSSIQRVQSELTDLRFAADHDSVYDLSVVFDEEQTKSLKQLAETYEEAVEVCDLYLREEISLECLFYEFIKLDLKLFLLPVQKFLPEELKQQFYSEEEESSEEQVSEEW